MKQKNKLAATEASASKVSASLTGRVTRLSKALVKEKEKIRSLINFMVCFAAFVDMCILMK